MQAKRTRKKQAIFLHFVRQIMEVLLRRENTLLFVPFVSFEAFRSPFKVLSKSFRSPFKVFRNISVFRNLSKSFEIFQNLSKIFVSFYFSNLIQVGKYGIIIQ